MIKAKASWVKNLERRPRKPTRTLVYLSDPNSIIAGPRYAYYYQGRWIDALGWDFRQNNILLWLEVEDIKLNDDFLEELDDD